MKSRKPAGSFAPHEIRRFILPISLCSIVLMFWVILEDLRERGSLNPVLLLYGGVLTAGTLITTAVIIRTENFRQSFGWFNAIGTGIGLGLLPHVLSRNLVESSHIFVPFGTIAVTILSGRRYGYLTLFIILLLNLPFAWDLFNGPGQRLEFVAPYLISLILLEAVARIQDTTQQHIHQLETINKVSRQLMLSLETGQTISLLNATIQEALEADSYFVGILKDNEIQFDLFYDEGEYFNGTRVPLEGTLSGWVIRNEKELFLPDLRRDVELEGVKLFVIGQDKTSLSWMGVPLIASNVRGILALGSYRSNAFDRADMELLSSLAQHISTALDNTIRHAQVEEQARLDSLTGVYNHGHFLKRLAAQAEETSRSNVPLSLIMLDIDFFKQYNDSYGHLVGDHILTRLCAAIKSHIKQTDAVGRWGGEEFIISLPGSTGAQARQVAERIGQTMETLRIEDRERQPIPAPTVSQGIAVYPHEADEIYRLIDLADRRLYIAKERGRNQIEPELHQWSQMQN